MKVSCGANAAVSNVMYMYTYMYVAYGYTRNSLGLPLFRIVRLLVAKL